MKPLFLCAQHQDVVRLPDGGAQVEGLLFQRELARFNA